MGTSLFTGKGSTFWFTALFEKQSGGKEAPAVIPAGIQEKRILTVDDKATNRELLSAYLKSWHCQYSTASSAQEALSLLHQAVEAGDPFHLVLLDHMMPCMDGEALGQVIKVDPTLKETVLVMLTSQGQEGDAARVKEIGFDASLTPSSYREVFLMSLTPYHYSDFLHPSDPLSVQPDQVSLE